jgi:two-component system, chemotaxis family, chemotaxis protein CheY
MSMRVLIVDDSRTARLMLRRVLPPSLSSEVVEAASGSEALAKIAAEQIDVMFLDLTMSGVDGYQVLKSLRETGRMPLTIVVSADVQPLAQARVRSLGAMAFVPKNINGTDLTSVLETAGLL